MSKDIAADFNPEDHQTEVVIDRIEGDYAVLEAGDDMVDFPLAALPPGVKEGGKLTIMNQNAFNEYLRGVYSQIGDEMAEKSEAAEKIRKALGLE
jgi:hypothetical protein